ncbi:MAG TPA: flagellar hook capping FlgD N-terminal domain-containing protein [Xanthobacteraceae bacterium]|nr:flagellar hook capping FlgD N-terminal domain-containing protein [Xanthobacteraceae bacterium]
MAVDATMNNPAVSAPSPTAGSKSTTNSAVTGGIADNFQTFLTLLTTQLQHQNPLDPLDTNQFTQQLVQFAQVEQQLRSNSQLTSLVELQTNAQATQALAFVGATAVVDGSTATMKNGGAQWSLGVSKPSTVKISISNSVGQTVFTGEYTADAGDQSFTWNGKGNDGTQWPDGTYTMSATAKDASGQYVGVTTQIYGVVDSADLTKSPPVLTIGGQEFTVDKIQRIVQKAS